MSIISDSDLNSRQELLNLDIADVSTTELVPNINLLVNLTECLSESLLRYLLFSNLILAMLRLILREFCAMLVLRSCSSSLYDI